MSRNLVQVEHKDRTH